MSRSNQLIQRSIITSNDSGQLVSGFLARLNEALAGRSIAWLSKASGVNDGTLRNYIRGAQPTIVPAVQISKALGVSLDWLLTGEAPPPKSDVSDRTRGRELFDASEADWIYLPHYDFEGGFESFAPVIRETYPVRRDWLNNQIGSTTGLWLTEMPSDDLPHIAHAGETVICRNSADLRPGRAFILGVDGQLIARQLRRRDDSVVFLNDAEDAAPIYQDDDYIPMGQILARYGLSKV